MCVCVCVCICTHRRARTTEKAEKRWGGTDKDEEWGGWRERNIEARRSAKGG